MREKRIKKWNRGWKIRLINEMNPSWRDLRPERVDMEPTANVHGFPPSRE
ncbi:hypothetical protein [Lysobacter arvi]|uniref:GIY-YIG nuclease family protein n=1 Tax=Lysobacter arvi TaxID=3038776 RepID=A0ABU1CF90_9GAMM|nr:hypothetical protein [Lysobacter arvi]MDR0183593.1 hypothetical protein [Lysobacter arvi]